ncbi:hypothetical protein W911_05720 [Hyphomicrobium nitrativorans NL23]|uniref:Uncharacterized protein n=1 Tax=Hyphomicrobium nitrativorans NL23 TaxID=1029756 RepID=V5SHH8_9HYPH|nr:hypothetical protein W911_05720 [Hyphomicrobium nitrativorans NL23]
MIAISRPMHTDRIRQSICRDLLGTAERIALALHDQRRAGEIQKMRSSQLLGLLRRMERIAKTHKARDTPAVEQRLRDKARDPPSERLSADEQPSAHAQRLRRCNGSLILRHQCLGLGRRAPASRPLPGRHIVEIET